MKIFISKQLVPISALSKLKKPLPLYGFMHEKEGITYIHSIGRRTQEIPLIGEIRTGSLPDNDNGTKIIGLKQEELIFYYRNNNGWQIAPHILFDFDGIYKRMPFPRNLKEKLMNSRVVIFGLGSGGSRLTEDLARAGVGRFDLVDPDRLSIENISRHICSLSDIGRFKVKAIKDRILLINPNAEINTYPFDLFKKSMVLKKVLAKADLVIGAADDEIIQLKLNRECWRLGIPALFGGCYELAKGGDILFIIPGETKICLECWLGKGERPEKLGKIDYSTAQSLRDYRGEPGLNAAINFITDVATQYAIALLLRNEQCEMAKLIDPQRNLLIIGGALGEGYYFFKKPFHFIRPIIKEPWKECGTCQSLETDKRE